MVNFEEFSKASRDQIIKNLDDFFGKKASEELPKYFYELEIFSSLSQMVSKGKLVRGILFLFACKMYGVKEEKELLDIACAIELLHTGLLIHDDIIDNDDLRRGLSTIHTYFKEKGKKIGATDASHYGVSMGILVGDAAFYCAIELLSRYRGARAINLLGYYSREVNRVILAEGADSEFGQTNIEPTSEEIEGIYHYKTARYTFSMPFTMAGIVAGITDARLEIMDKIGELAGFIFQLKDDELGLLGTEEKIGKPVGSDVRENKKTAIRKLLYEMVNDSEKELLNTLFGKQNITRDEVNKVKELIEKYEIQKKINIQVEEIMEEIHKLFNNLEVDDEYKKVLQEMLIFNIKRKY